MNFDELNQCFVVYLGRSVGRLAGCFGLIGMFVAYSVSLLFSRNKFNGNLWLLHLLLQGTGCVVCSQIQIQSICKRIPNTLSRKM